MTFNPQEHMIDLKGKQYLPVAWRLVWFRDDYPQGAISTEVLGYEPLLVKAYIHTQEGVLLATGHGGAVAKPGAVWSGREIEKAETAAIGRALGHAGYGTQFEADDEGDFLADSPVERMPQNTTQKPAETAKQSAKVQSSTNTVETASTGDINAYFTLGANHFNQINWKERNNTIKKIFDEGGFAGKSEQECIAIMSDRFAAHDRKVPASEMEF